MVSSLSNSHIFGGIFEQSLAWHYFWGVPLTVQTLLVRNIGGLIESFFTKDHEYQWWGRVNMNMMLEILHWNVFDGKQPSDQVKFRVCGDKHTCSTLSAFLWKHFFVFLHDKHYMEENFQLKTYFPQDTWQEEEQPFLSSILSESELCKHKETSEM